MKRPLFLLAVAAVAYATVAHVRAADHIDSPAAVSDPAADITDLYAWMSPDTENLNLIMNVNPFSGSDAQFSDAVQYVFHVNSSSAYGEAQTETQIICQFFDTDMIECWAGDSYVIGDPSDTSGITSDDDALRVFAGPRDDPFFMEFNGFTETVAIVVEAAGSLTFDDDGCPNVDEDTSAVLVGQLQSGTEGAAASDTFAGGDVLSLIVQIDVDKVNAGGSLLGVWASTHRE